MSVISIQRLRRLPQWLLNRASIGGLILLYHRIAEPTVDPYSICVTPRQFAEHLDIISRRARPMRLDDMLRAAQHGAVPPRAVALTFDDGYVDNLTDAVPLLERFGIPATFFAITHGRSRPLWWDELARLLLANDTGSGHLDLTIRGVRHTWRWNSPAKRRASFFSVYELIQPLSSAAQDDAIAQIQRGNASAPAASDDARLLSVDELTALDANALIDIGAHTMSHPVLPVLTAEEQRREIAGSKEFLEQLLGHRITAFAYPFGRFTALTAELVARAGFSHACSTVPDFLRGRPDPFLLPRISVGSCDGEGFAQIARWLQ